jgi:hypothetical protein
MPSGGGTIDAFAILDSGNLTLYNGAPNKRPISAN